MPTPVISSHELFQKVASHDFSNDAKLEQILQLKTHVKKDFVDILQVPGYFEALSIAVDIHELGILTNAFSVISHLVKRVSMQDKTGQVLKLQSYLILPIIINRMGDSKHSTKNAAMKAIEAYWFSAPKEVEDSLLDIALKSRSLGICTEVVNLLHHFVRNVNQHFKLDRFMPQLILLVNGDADNVSYLAALKELFTTYYNLKHNKLYKFDLARELELQNTPLSISNTLMSGITGFSNYETNHSVLNPRLPKEVTMARNEIHKETKLSNSRPQSSPRPQPSLKEEPIKTSNPKVSETKNHEAPIPETITPELQAILSKVKYSLDPSINSIDFTVPEAISSTINECLPPFNGKETEFNWVSREKSILKLRSIMRGNARIIAEDILLVALRDSAEGICKSINSLRTTLSTNGCQLVKEIAIILGNSVDSLMDLFTPHLLKLCSATKHIALNNANMALCALFANCSFNARLFTKISVASQEKNILPRSYSGLWLQILILRFHKNLMTASSHGSSTGLDICSKVCMKLLGDPNPNVRQVGKDTFWCYFEKFPKHGEAMLTKLDPKIVKGLERSRPLVAKVTSVLQAKKPRVSLKESIIEKNKEIRRRESTNSRPSSRASSDLLVHHNQSLPGSFSSSHGGNSSTKDIHWAPSRVTHSARRINSAQSKNTPTPTETVDNVNAGHEPLRDDSTKVNHSMNSVQEPEQVATDNDTAVTNEVLDEKQDRKSMSFDIQQDPILKFLSCKDPELVKEGINLLKYAIMGEEELSKEVNELLKAVSIRNPTLLKPLLSSELLLKKSFQFFSSEDFFRICSILLDPVSEKDIDLIIAIVDVNQIYNSITKLLSYTISTSNILEGDDNLTIQIIRYKSNIIKMIVDFLQQSLDKIPISDKYFLQIISNLFELFSLVKSTEVYESFTILMKKFYSINSSLFLTELGQQDENIKEEIEDVVEVDKSFKAKDEKSSVHLEPFFELTQVKPNSNFEDLSPVKLTTDFTMLMPMVKENNELTYLPRKNDPSDNDNAMEVDVDMGLNNEASQEARPTSKENLKDLQSDNLNEADSNMATSRSESKELDLIVNTSGGHSGKLSSEENPNREDIHSRRVLTQDANFTSDSVLSTKPTHDVSNAASHSQDSIFMDKGAAQPNLFFQLAPNSQSDRSTELVDNFAQVKITERNSRQYLELDLIQLLIDKVDPLKSVSRRNKPIKIFEDNTGSPQKVKEYDYSDSNWFNFQISKNSTTISGMNQLSDAEQVIQQFKTICEHICTAAVLTKEIMVIISLLQLSTDEDLQLAKYLRSDGGKLLESSLWNFFQTQPPRELLLNALLLLKQLHINRSLVNLENLWETMVSLSNTVSKDKSGLGSRTEFLYALGDVFDETLSGMYSTSDIMRYILRSLASVEYDKRQNERPSSLIFVLDCLSKILSQNSISLAINDDLVTHIDTLLHRFLGDSEVEVRRFVIQSYGKLLHASRISHTMEKDDKPFEKSAICTILNRMSATQKKLVEYYSET